MHLFDVAIVGGGPAGSSCAASCAVAGLRTLVLDREKFPREKVCGDCLNPSCWPVFERLELTERVRDLPHSKLSSVEFIAIDGRKVIVDFPSGAGCEISVKRSLLDDLLLNRAGELGADVHEQTTATGLSENGHWKIETASGEFFQARILIGADGRNSTVARLCNLFPPSERERVALQAHVPGPIVKFYAVADGRFFSWYPADGGRVEIAEQRLRELVFAAARAVGLEIFGGDVAFPTPDDPVLIDLNDWPSFAPVRVDAAAAIAAYIDDKASNGKPA